MSSTGRVQGRHRRGTGDVQDGQRRGTTLQQRTRAQQHCVCVSKYNRRETETGAVQSPQRQCQPRNVQLVASAKPAMCHEFIHFRNKDGLNGSATRAVVRVTGIPTSCLPPSCKGRNGSSLTWGQTQHHNINARLQPPATTHLTMHACPPNAEHPPLANDEVLCSSGRGLGQCE